jgi:hypothetical protein
LSTPRHYRGAILSVSRGYISYHFLGGVFHHTSRARVF